VNVRDFIGAGVRAIDAARRVTLLPLSRGGGSQPNASPQRSRIDIDHLAGEYTIFIHVD
jgi:hypothetical protein